MVNKNEPWEEGIGAKGWVMEAVASAGPRPGIDAGCRCPHTPSFHQKALFFPVKMRFVFARFCALQTHFSPMESMYFKKSLPGCVWECPTISGGKPGRSSLLPKNIQTKIIQHPEILD